MTDGTLLEAFQTEFPAYEQPPLGQRRALFFSGMYGSEITEVIAAYRCVRVSWRLKQARLGQ